ncbi:hypothetical protein [Planotetraspora kaengkrachanensis]|uniref:Uncharacterized protein n=1 Tax=Planotetraspora kaengkrachanensis TaxID=575193 RepID=A0A8J3LV19_9ACTN|nr:hypothetical protein [Planotetraspora kaengkrachanensis]GIG77300.1 hypothetical protein Pka01_04270 [Planotetraspora kaengkrachanensis]
MGMFNQVTVPEAIYCPMCGEDRSGWFVQFYYGDLILQDYELGQDLFWDMEWEWIGHPSIPGVWAQGVLLGCPVCHFHFDDPHDEFYIVEIRHNRIVGVIKDESGYGWWAEDWVAVPDR